MLYGRADSGNGEQITQPGGGGVLNRIGDTAAGVFNERVDCGLLKIDTSQRNIDGGVLGISGSVTGIRRAKIGDKVISSGAGKNGTSKKGEIDDVELERSLTFAGGTRKFVKQFRIKPRGNSPTTAKGDSGSVWLFEETQELVGLHFAGSQQAAFANPIQAVIDAFASRGFNLGI